MNKGSLINKKGLEDKSARVTTEKVDMASVLSDITINPNVKMNATVDMTQALMSMLEMSTVREASIEKIEDNVKERKFEKEEKEKEEREKVEEEEEEEKKENNNYDDEYSIENILKRAGIDVSMLTDEEKEEIYNKQKESLKEISREAKMQMQKKMKRRKR